MQLVDYTVYDDLSVREKSVISDFMAGDDFYYLDGNYCLVHSGIFNGSLSKKSDTLVELLDLKVVFGDVILLGLFHYIAETYGKGMIHHDSLRDVLGSMYYDSFNKYNKDYWGIVRSSDGYDIGLIRIDRIKPHFEVCH